MIQLLNLPCGLLATSLLIFGAAGLALPRAFNVRADWTNDFRWGRLSQTLRVDNLADHRYVGSVIVNESNGRYYEPSPGRTALYLLSVALR